MKCVNICQCLFQRFQLMFWVVMEIGYWQIYICNLLFLFDLAQISTPEHCCAKPDIE